jgi:hypothetical protein
MRRLAVLLAALALASPAPAQEIPEATAKDFWCGIAFDMASRDVPADAAPEVLSVTTPYKTGAETLLGRAKAIYLESGYTEEAFAALRTETEAEIAAQLASTDPAIEPQYSFEDCAALIGL